MKKKFMAMVACVAMIVAMLPTVSLAAEALPEASAGKITLEEDVSLSAPVEISSDTTLDLGGKTLTLNQNAYIWVKNGSLNVVNGTINAAGDAFIVGQLFGGTDATGNTSLNIGNDVSVNVTGTNYNCVYVRANAFSASVTTAGKLKSENGAAIQGNGMAKGDVTVTGGSVESGNSIAIYHPQNGALTISGGTVKGTTAVYAKSGTVNISGGTLEATGAKAEYVPNSNGANATGDALVVETSSNTAYEAPTVSITGGTFSSANAAAVGSYAGTGMTAPKDFISGGSFTSDVSEYLKDGYVLKSGTVGLEKAVVKMNGTEYSSIQAALDAAPEGTATTITLLADSTESFDVKANKKITLDLNSKIMTLGPAIGSTGTETSGARVLYGGELTIQNGKIEISENTNAHGKHVLVGLANYGTMTIDSVQMGTKDFVYISINNRGDLTLKGNTNIATAPALDPKMAITNDPYNYTNGKDVNASLTINDENVVVGNVCLELGETDGNNGVPVLNISAGTIDAIVVAEEGSLVPVGNITGGSFGTDPTAYLAEGYTFVTKDGLYNVCEASVIEEVPEDKEDDSVVTTKPSGTVSATPKTGDTTNMMMYVVMMAAAIVVGTLAVVFKRRNAR